MPGTLTTAVIDALRGAPAKGMLVDLFRLAGNVGERHHLRTIETNDKGTIDAPLVAGDALVPATYELLYHIGRYFKAQRVALDDGPFLDVVPVRFAVSDAARAYHVALVVTPLSYTMYRA
jgi:5-hydroxyisourate hydrolase